MDGYTLKQNNQKSWAIVYVVIRKGVFTLSEDKENFQQGEHLRVSLLSSPAIYVGKVTGDNKRYSSIYFIKMTFNNETSTSSANNSPTLNTGVDAATDKASTVTLGFRIEETRNTWLYAIMTEHAKLFINRQPIIDHSPSSPSSVSSLHSSFKQRASLRKRRSVPTDEQQQQKQQQRRRSLSLNFENMIRQRPLSRVFSSIFATNSNNNNNGTANKTPTGGKGRRDGNNNPFGFFTPWLK